MCYQYMGRYCEKVLFTHRVCNTLPPLLFNIIASLSFSLPSLPSKKHTLCHDPLLAMASRICLSSSTIIRSSVVYTPVCNKVSLSSISLAILLSTSSSSSSTTDVSPDERLTVLLCEEFIIGGTPGFSCPSAGTWFRRAFASSCCFSLR